MAKETDFFFFRDIKNAEGSKEPVPEQPTAGSLGMPAPHSSPQAEKKPKELKS